MKQERLSFLANNPFYTKRFAYYVGRRCRESSIQAVAKELHLDWQTTKDLEKQYMTEQLRRYPAPAPGVLGIDEVSIRKGHVYRIVVSDLERHRPIWFGGQDRSEESMDQFFAALGPKKCRKIPLAVMDMWKPFRHSTQRHAPQAAILFDKFHVLRQLGEALDQVRKSEYARLTGPQRRFIKGQKYTLLAHREHLKPDWPQKSPASAGGQPATQHGLCTQGILRTTVELHTSHLGPQILRELEVRPEVAASGTV